MSRNVKFKSKEDFERWILDRDCGIFTTLSNIGQTRNNYLQIIKVVKKHTDCLFLEIDEIVANEIKTKLDADIALIDESKKITKTTAHVYKRVLISCGKKAEELITKKQMQDQFKNIFGFEYKNPFNILNDKVQFNAVVGKSEKEFPVENAINEFMDLVEKSSASDFFLINLMFYLGLLPYQICQLTHKSIVIKENRCYLQYLNGEEIAEVVLNSNAHASYIRYMQELIRMKDKKKEQIMQEDSLFINRVGKPYNLKGISSIILKYNREMKSNTNSKITSLDLVEIAMARKSLYYYKYYSPELKQFFYINENEEKKIHKRLDKIVDANGSVEEALAISPWCIVQKEFENNHLQRWDNEELTIKDLEQIQASIKG